MGFTAFSLAGSEFGNVIFLPVCGYLCEYVNWQSVFYITGAIGILWFLVWALIVFDGPDVHPRISEQEKQFLQMSLKETQSEKPSSVPWKDIVISAPVWAILVSHVTQSFGFYVLFTELPTYMKNVLNYDMSSKAFLSGLPYLAMVIVGALGSIVADFAIKKEIFSKTVVRKIANTIATVGPALALIGASFVGYRPDAAMVLLTVSVGCNGFIYSGEQSNMIDIAPNFSGTLMGIVNTLGNTMGFVAPALVGYIIKGHNDVEHWQIVFWIASAVYTLGSILFIFLGTAEEQHWNTRYNKRTALEHK